MNGYWSGTKSLFVSVFAFLAVLKVTGLMGEAEMLLYTLGF